MNKLILTALLSLAVLLPGYAQSGECGGVCGTESCPRTCEAFVGETEVIECQPAAECETAAAMTPEGPESKIATRMTQAEKARNAAENDSWGGAITLIAMCIVISALVVLSILFYLFGKVSEAMLKGKKARAAEKASVIGVKVAESNHVDSGEVIAAIAMALSEHFGEGHDVEDTILTIRTMKRAYSPWNSKIYNLRQVPELHRNNGGNSAF